VPDELSETNSVSVIVLVVLFAVIKKLKLKPPEELVVVVA
jgi:hypothetical protein